MNSTTKINDHVAATAVPGNPTFHPLPVGKVRIALSDSSPGELLELAFHAASIAQGLQAELKAHGEAEDGCAAAFSTDLILAVASAAIAEAGRKVDPDWCIA